MKTFFRTAALFTAFSLPLVNTACSKSDNETVEKVVKSKETIDFERKILDKRERLLTRSFEIWADNLYLVLIDLHMLRENKEPVPGVNRAHGLLRTIDEFQKEIGFNPSNKIQTPNKDQIESFIKVINVADEAAKVGEAYINLPLDTIANRIEKHLRNKNPNAGEDEIRERKRIHFERFVAYKKTQAALSKYTESFVKALETFNKDAAAVGEPEGGSVWGLTIEHLKGLKSIK